MNAQFYNDNDIARFVGVSPSWVRLQRHFRKHNKPHVFDIDPIFLGSRPRYPVDAVQAWLEKLKDKKQPTHT
jgi:hypothetical protein